MEEEKKEIVPEEKIEEQEEKKEEPSKEDFEKEKEVVPANKFNQALRKQREAEAEKRELEKQLAEKETPPVKEEKKEEEDIFEEKKEVPDPEVLINEKLKPVLEKISKTELDNKKKDRTAFFSTHPEYLGDAERWQTLLDEMDNSLNPNSKDTYYEQLEKAHRIIAGDPGNAEVEQKKTEMAGDASSGRGAQKGSLKEEFTPEERKYQKEWNISDEGMKAYKEKLKSGSMRILT